MKKLNVIHLSSIRCFERGRCDLPDALAKLGADAITNDRVWEIASIQQIIKICSTVKPVCLCLDGSISGRGRLCKPKVILQMLPISAIKVCRILT